MTGLFSRPPTNRSKCETWTWLFPNLSWTTDGIIYHHCPKIRSKEEKERRRWLQDTARTKAAVVETYGTRIFGLVFAGNQWHLIGCTSRLCCQRERFCFQGWKIWHQRSINAGIISDAVHQHSTWLDGTFTVEIFCIFDCFWIIPWLECIFLTGCTYFSYALHDSELQMDPLPWLWNSDDLSACKSLPYLAVCQHVTVKGLWTSAWWQLQESRANSFDHVVIVQLLLKLCT